ncbi:MAG: hypothetical protein RLZZ358_1583 [Bacteroidota bacterium]|jgi:hypothetical protein
MKTTLLCLFLLIFIVSCKSDPTAKEMAVVAADDKTLVKKLVKEAVKKIGGRTLGGIGLAMVVADIAYCMYD